MMQDSLNGSIHPLPSSMPINSYEGPVNSKHKKDPIMVVACTWIYYKIWIVWYLNVTTMNLKAGRATALMPTFSIFENKTTCASISICYFVYGMHTFYFASYISKSQNHFLQDVLFNFFFQASDPVLGLAMPALTGVPKSLTWAWIVNCVSSPLSMYK